MYNNNNNGRLPFGVNPNGNTTSPFGGNPNNNGNFNSQIPPTLISQALSNYNNRVHPNSNNQAQSNFSNQVHPNFSNQAQGSVYNQPRNNANATQFPINQRGVNQNRTQFPGAISNTMLFPYKPNLDGLFSDVSDPNGTSRWGSQNAVNQLGLFYSVVLFCFRINSSTVYCDKQ